MCVMLKLQMCTHRIVFLYTYPTRRLCSGYDAVVQAVAGIFTAYILKRVLLWRDTSVALLGMLSSVACVLAIGMSGFMVPASQVCIY